MIERPAYPASSAGQNTKADFNDIRFGKMQSGVSPSLEQGDSCDLSYKQKSANPPAGQKCAVSKPDDSLSGAVMNHLRRHASGHVMAMATISSHLLPGFLTRPLFFAPPKASSLQALKSDTLKQEIQEVYFPLQGRENPQLHGWYLKAQENKPTVVFSHGRNSNISQLEPMLTALKTEGYGVFAYDYPGYGQSEGQPSEQNLYDAGLSACKLLAGDPDEGHGLGVPFKDQVLMGHSLGGAVAVKVAKELCQNENTRPKALVVVNSFANLHAPLSRQGGFSPAIYSALSPKVSKKRFSQFNSTTNIKYVNTPTAILHASGDCIIHYKNGKKLFKSAVSAPKKEFHVLSQGDHKLSDSLCKDVVEKLNQFLAKRENDGTSIPGDTQPALNREEA